MTHFRVRIIFDYIGGENLNPYVSNGFDKGHLNFPAILPHLQQMANPHNP